MQEKLLFDDKKCNRLFKASSMCCTSSFKVRSFNDILTCSLENRFQENKHATSFFIANIVKKTYRETSSYFGPINIQEERKCKYEIDIDYGKAWRVRELVTLKILVKTSVSYQNIPAYLHMLKQSNPGTFTILKTLDAR